jgi:hypothetical protein
MQSPPMDWGKDIVALEAVPAQVGDGWRIFIQWVSGRVQYISGFDSLQDAENWIKTEAHNWVSSARNQL